MKTVILVMFMLSVDVLWVSGAQANDFKRAKDRSFRMQKLSSGKIVAHPIVKDAALLTDPLPQPFPPSTPPREVKPTRYGQMRAKVTRETVDYRGDVPTWTFVEICEVVGPAPVFDLVNVEGYFYDIPSIGCHVTLDNQEGDLMLTGFMVIDKEGGVTSPTVKSFSSNFGFFSDSPTPPHPTPFPPNHGKQPKNIAGWIGDGSTSYTRDLSLNHLGMHLRSGTYTSMTCELPFPPPTSPVPPPASLEPGHGKKMRTEQNIFTVNSSPDVPISNPSCVQGGGTIFVKIDIEDRG
ncbi:MAG: hypothetical protein IPK04_11900 [Bdellovibrionales bacterium]|nr:hypothetical protein [Bdellovibrionales bacterium]